MTRDLSTIRLADLAQAWPAAWRSRVVGRTAGANFTVTRMDAAVYPDGSPAFDDARWVLDGPINSEIQGQPVAVSAGEVFVVPAGVPQAVAPGSHGSLVVIDP